MQRRSFLTGLLGIIGGSAVAKPGIVKPKPSILLQQSPIAGFQYHEGERLWSLLAKGDPLTLVREPDNEYDKRAVRVEWQGHKLGYIPRRDNATISQMLDRSETLMAKIAAKHGDDNPWKRIKMQIWAEI
jgi:hypothetical protein